ncbi:hypothetical protein B0J13DRAFT_564264 [Dactylonectria estremocensis]|uniref:Uncharacterized protein n=1 Tax=Dactylonectria estremocensis TaxID=1079267 RepID=A0A9P9E189_9HYPO|nr:hypothetical protein B0J13DRAFT_564264 [Dactylonectria estremocensis]
MSESRSDADEQTGSPPSRQAIDDGNPAVFKPRFFVLDDTNIDLISFASIVGALISVSIFNVPIKLAASAAAFILLPLRLFLPKPKPPTGLVLITGASSGIGAELSYIFAEKGHEIILVGRDDKQLSAVKGNVEAKGGPSAHIVALDLSLPGAAERLYSQVKKAGFTVDVLINCAGLGGTGETLEQPIELAERMIITNCMSLVQLTQLFGKDMAERRCGWILQVSSVGGWIATPHQNIYHATKHFVRAFSEALSIELRAYPGVVNTQLMPGPTHTQFVTRAHAEEIVMMAASGAMEDPKAVAMAGYKGLSNGKRMVFSSWNAALTSLLMHLAPRSVHLTVASIMNAPLRGKMRAKEPLKDQNQREPFVDKK